MEMFLTLQVIRNKGLAPAEPKVFHVGRSGGVIGRSPDNEFVLPDPEKFISRKHGILKFENGEFYFTDTSAAGTYFSNRDMLLQHDTTALRDGDNLRIGNYELLVRKETQEPAPTDFFHGKPEPWPPTAQAPEPHGFPPNSLFDLHDDPFGLDAPMESKPEGPSFLDQPDVAPEHANFVAPQPLSEISDLDIEDLLNTLDIPEAVSKPSGEPEQLPDDLFSEYLSELAPAEPAAPLVLPDLPVPDAATPDSAEAAVDFEIPDSEILAEDRTASTAVGMDRADSPNPIPSPGRVPLPPPEPPVSIRPVQPAATAPNPEPSEPVARPSAGPVATPAELFRWFLEGAGISDPPPFGDEEIPALMKTLGLLFHDLIDGMMTVLRARAEEKRELRVEMTTMRAVDNNPLKAVPNARDALKIMLAARDPGFVGPIEAVRESFRDLMSHQLATTAGMQASLAEQLKRFDPGNFEKLYSEGLVFQKKAKCWETYSQAYPDLVRDVLENFFGDKFREVYERQIHAFRSGSGRGSQ